MFLEGGGDGFQCSSWPGCRKRKLGWCGETEVLGILTHYCKVPL